ncbi:hypothetical protein ACOSQ4_005361 [Xanthoceras sorbifolium]
MEGNGTFTFAVRKGEYMAETFEASEGRVTSSKKAHSEAGVNKRKRLGRNQQKLISPLISLPLILIDLG